MISESSLTTGEMGGDIEGVSIEKRNVRVLPPSATYEKMENIICSLENGMLRHSLGGAVIFISMQHFILPYLTYCPVLIC